MARHSLKEQIVEAGMKTFLEKGFNGCGVQEITSTAGVPKGSFYNHFESKEALGAEIVDRYGEGTERRKILRDRTLHPLKRLKRYFEDLMTISTESNFERGCLLGNFSAEVSTQSPLIRERLDAIFVRWTKDIETAIADAQEQGLVATDLKAGVLASVVLDAYEGAVLRAKVEKNRRALDAFMKVTFSRILAPPG
ncbi:TetR/AcrR family transcriptional regulator [Bradyrhizobium prioriisuperbiae]|uniref:TetR/AcrR family transcriptional regulator n=1 Tax=Bradyrhizobium prioriisuperbiae TaxID=2854389 RepID=UPI0028E6ADF0|nr:TetR family transcriptional regulator C-terminal domain-containing protein [Bradyrhizobium prioritasuperba]